jgi:hypothetical protein
MPLVNAHGTQIFFAHVPKTAGSSVEDYLIRRFGELSIRDQHKRNRVAGTGLITPSTHLSALDLLELLPRDLAHCFAFVRDPVDRMLSEYRYQLGVSKTTRFGFSTWLRLMLGCARREPRIYENHIRPQSDLVPDSAKVFRLEDGFEPFIAWLDQVTGTTAPEVEMGHLLKREHAEVALSRQDLRLMAAFYAEDYARFGYATPDTSAIGYDAYAPLRSGLAARLAPMIVLRQRQAWLR